MRAIIDVFHCTSRSQRLAPRIVGVAGDDVAVGIHDFVHVALHVLHIVVRGAVVREAQQVAVAVVDVPNDGVTGLFSEDRAAVGEVVGGTNKSLPTAAIVAVGGFWVCSCEEAMQRELMLDNRFCCTLSVVASLPLH